MVFPSSRFNVFGTRLMNVELRGSCIGGEQLRTNRRVLLPGRFGTVLRQSRYGPMSGDIQAFPA